MTPAPSTVAPSRKSSSSAVADLDQHYFASRMTALGVDASRLIAVAVSGGVDSMVLAHLALGWAQKNNAQIYAFTVDHRLRPESGREATQVKATLEGWGVPCDVLIWQDAAGGSALQARARTARYELLAQACKQKGIAQLLLGHQADDQAETFWLRLVDGSGIDGLGGMKPRRDEGALALLRPMLAVTRGDIRAYAVANNIRVIEDPSNTADKFTRVRLRGLVDSLQAEGLTPQRLGLVMQKIADATAALDWVRDDFLARHVQAHRAGVFLVDAEAFKKLPTDLQRRVLTELLGRHSPSAYPPRHQALDDLRLAVCGANFGGATLQGCHVFMRGAHIWVAREVAAISSHIDVGPAPIVWDNRFVVRSGGGPLRLAALAAGGILQLSVKETPELAALPEIARRGLPAVYEGEKLVYIPYLSDEERGLSAGLAPDFCKSLNIV